MRNFAILVALVFMIGGGFLIGGSASATSARVVEGEIPAAPAIGATIEDFTLPDVTGTERSLKSLAGKKGTVLLFVAVQCPVSNAYNERLQRTFRSEEHTSELQSQSNLVCRLLLEKKKKKTK